MIISKYARTYCEGAGAALADRGVDWFVLLADGSFLAKGDVCHEVWEGKLGGVFT